MKYYDMDVNTKQDFIKYLELLREDFKKNGNQWQNSDLDSFLEALLAYTKDIDGYYKNTGQNIDVEKITWKMLADLMNGAVIYE